MVDGITPTMEAAKQQGSLMQLFPRLEASEQTHAKFEPCMQTTGE